MKRAYSYLRFSDPRQSGGDSTRRQTTPTDELCRKRGWHLDDSLHLDDKGKSAFHAANLAPTAALTSFRDAVRSGRVQSGSVLIVENLDRLSRQLILRSVNLFSDILESGITVVTLSPLQEYTYDTVNANIGLLFEMVMTFFLAHEESRKKSERVLAEWRQRLTKIHEKKLTARCPGWLRLREDRAAFEFKPEAAKIVRQIYQWAKDGMGVFNIVRKLNGDGIPCIGGRKGKTLWHHSYVSMILKDRACIGEFQSYTGKGSKAKPFGPVVRGYYPAVVTESVFDSVQVAKASRRTQRGPAGHEVANLFTGLLRDARDGSPMTMTVKHKSKVAKAPGTGPGQRKVIAGPRSYVSSNAQRGVGGATYISFPAQILEDGFLRWLSEVKVSDLLPAEDGGTVDEIAAESGRLEMLENKIVTIKGRIDANPDVEDFLDVLAETNRQKKASVERLAKLKEQATAGASETVGEAQSLALMLRDAVPEERETLRLRLKAKIRLIVDDVVCLFCHAKYRGTRRRVFGGRVACLQVHFKSGRKRMICIASWNPLTVKVDDVEPSHDFRKAYKWFEKCVEKNNAAVAGVKVAVGTDRHESERFGSIFPEPVNS